MPLSVCGVQIAAPRFTTHLCLASVEGKIYSMKAESLRVLCGGTSGNRTRVFKKRL